MAGGAQTDRGGIIAGINVTPLVDIMMVLLVVFIVTAKIVVSPAVPLDLPPATQSQQIQVILSVVVPASGDTLVNGTPVTDDADFVRRAKQSLAGDPELRAVINADGAAPHRRVLHTLDLLKSAGLARVAFGALPEEEAHQ
jgi:biopolymer transport protein TolR